jgi:hypothetical protein
VSFGRKKIEKNESILQNIRNMVYLAWGGQFPSPSVG